jgi:hypothetical protein
MVFLETSQGESDRVLSEAIGCTFARVCPEISPVVEFGSLIEWEHRLFREVRATHASEHHLLLEDLIFLSAKMDQFRATLQLGAFCGKDDAVWVTPPPTGAEIAAQVIDQGCQSVVKPFFYENKG